MWKLAVQRDVFLLEHVEHVEGQDALGLGFRGEDVGCPRSPPIPRRPSRTSAVTTPRSQGCGGGCSPCPDKTYPNFFLSHAKPSFTHFCLRLLPRAQRGVMRPGHPPQDGMG